MSLHRGDTKNEQAYSVVLRTDSLATAVGPQETHAQAISVVEAYKTEKVPHPNTRIDPSDIVLVVQVTGFSDSLRRASEKDITPTANGNVVPLRKE
jgi:hypothetical protein